MFPCHLVSLIKKTCQCLKEVMEPSSDKVQENVLANGGESHKHTLGWVCWLKHWKKIDQLVHKVQNVNTDVFTAQKKPNQTNVISLLFQTKGWISELPCRLWKLTSHHRRVTGVHQNMLDQHERNNANLSF